MKRRLALVVTVALGASGLLGVGAAGAQTLPPTVAVAPFADLVHDQEVQVAGFGYPPNQLLMVSQCVAGVDDFGDCDWLTNTSTTANEFGAFQLTTRLRRLMGVHGEVVDCAAAAGTCVVSVTRHADDGQRATFPIHFDPDAPLPTPTIVISPDTDLEHRDEVSVTGTGFTPNANIGVQQCANAFEPDGPCAGFRVVQADAGGAIATTVGVLSVLRGEGATFDCAASPGACSIVAFRPGDFVERAQHALAFDATAPPPPLPTVAVTPDHDLVDRQVITVSGSGFAPNDSVDVKECITGADPFLDPGECELGFFNLATDASGAFSATRLVARHIDVSGPDDVDCGAAPGTCEMFFGSYTDPLAVGRVALTFDPAAAPVAPDMKARPRKDLHAGQMITVSGSGFSPNATIVIAQCKFQPSGPNDCDMKRVVQLQADHVGQFETQFKVRGRLKTLNGIVSCKAVPGACVIGGSNLNDIDGENDRAARLIFSSG